MDEVLLQSGTKILVQLQEVRLAQGFPFADFQLGETKSHAIQFHDGWYQYFSGIVLEYLHGSLSATYTPHTTSSKLGKPAEYYVQLKGGGKKRDEFLDPHAFLRAYHTLCLKLLSNILLKENMDISELEALRVEEQILWHKVRVHYQEDK